MFLSFGLYDTSGLVPDINVLFWWLGDFLVSYSDRNTLWNTWNRYSGSFIIDLAQRSLSLTNVKWHSDHLPVIVTSQPIRFFTKLMTSIPCWTFIELQLVYLEHLRWVLLTSKERLPFRRPGSFTFWDLLFLQLLIQVVPNLPCLSSNFHLKYPSVLSRFCFLI